MMQDRFATILRATTAAPLVVTLAFPPLAAAGSLEVKLAATAGGSFGLQVNVEKTPCSPDDLIINSPPLLPDINGDFEACKTITAGGVQVITPGATFTAGESIILEDNFSVGLAAPFTVRLFENLGTPFAYVEDDTPNSETSYQAVFWMNIDGLTLAGDDRLEVLNGYSEGGQIQFQLILKRNMSLGENRLVLAARRNDGSFAETPFGQERLVPSGYNEIGMRWFPGAGNGYLTASLNGASGPGLSGLNNSNSRVDFVRLGAVGGTLDPSTSGFFYLDEFESLRVFHLTEATCIVPDDGSGTGEFPPVGCAYLSPLGAYTISNGLPAGTEIELEPIHRDLSCPLGGCGVPGGALGGETEFFNGTLVLQAVGTGSLEGFERLLTLGMGNQTYSGPRNPGDSVQTFATEMFQMGSSISPGDPDFDQLTISAGAGASLPTSTGQTTMTQLPSGDFSIDSFFDISWSMFLAGKTGSVLEGLTGTTTGLLRLEAFADPLPIFTDGFESGDVSAWSGAVP